MYKAAADFGGVTYKVHEEKREFFVDKILLPSVRYVVPISTASHWPSSYKDEGRRSQIASGRLNFSYRLLTEEYWRRLLQEMRLRITDLGNNGEEYADFVFISTAMGLKIPYDIYFKKAIQNENSLCGLDLSKVDNHADLFLDFACEVSRPKGSPGLYTPLWRYEDSAGTVFNATVQNVDTVLMFGITVGIEFSNLVGKFFQNPVASNYRHDSYASMERVGGCAYGPSGQINSSGEYGVRYLQAYNTSKEPFYKRQANTNRFNMDIAVGAAWDGGPRCQNFFVSVPSVFISRV